MRQVSLVLFFLLFNLCNLPLSLGQASDHHYPATRNAYHNSAMQAYIYHEVGDYITQSYDYIYVLNNFYNTNYLFHEPISWAKRVNRVVDLKDHEEAFKAQLDFLFQNIQLSMFKDTSYSTSFSPQEVDSLRDSIGVSYTQITIRENWYYHPKIKGFKSAKIAIGIMSNEGKVLGWYAYPNLRTFLLLAAVEFEKYPNFDSFLNDRLFPTKSISSSSTICADTYSRYEFGNELDALFEIAEFVNRVRYWETLNKKQRSSIIPANTAYSLNAQNQLQGIAKWKSFTTQAQCQVNFESGIANGAYEMRLKDQVLERGTFVNGLREGSFESFYITGKKRSQYFYKASSQDSLQKVWYPNGQLHIEYEMKEGEMHGSYNSFQENGDLFEKGQFQNGYISGEWSYKIPMIHYFCYYMNETSFEWTIKEYILEDAFKDCMMELDMYVEKRKVSGCPEGICLIAYLKGDIH